MERMKKPYLYILSFVVLIITVFLCIQDAYNFFFTNEGIKYYGGWPWGVIIGVFVFLLSLTYIILILYLLNKSLKDKRTNPELKDRPNR
jgi:uncharacterized membrane protein